MGSGKSVTGEKLAGLLGLGFADLDELIEERAGRSVVEIFEKEGEEYFRNRESEILREIAGTGPQVVATGGGSVLRDENVLRMRETGKILFLETSLPVLWERVKRKKDRPLLKKGDPYENLKRIFDQRAPIYSGVSDLQVNTDSQTAEAVAVKIFELLEKRK